MTINYENLEKIAAYTEKRPQEGFNMMQYCQDDRGHSVSHACGTLMCIIGDLPALKGEFSLRSDEVHSHVSGQAVDWSSYSGRVTGLDDSGDEWEYLFGGDWVYTDNTPKGAAARIRYFIENGLPEDPYGEMEGSEPLSYVDNDDES